MDYDCTWYDDSLHIPDPNVIRSTTTSSFKENRNNSKIITFSHFLTSKKLMKAYIDEMSLRRQQSTSTHICS
ncbi:unnamed protein product [Rotaria magnacalcarata]